MNSSTWPWRIVLAVLLAALTFSSSARELDQDEVLKMRSEGLILPLEQLLQVALERHPGAVLLEAELEEEDGQLVYEVELVTSAGIVRELELHAVTGAVLKDEVDD
ncbi:PepSY domain-containing protein [Pseudomonas sp.]|uniref:PepSY domain-containing protein n=1 Tax=Pseudomonas sp. TaxID=306 RepID=UPI003C70B56F